MVSLSRFSSRRLNYLVSNAKKLGIHLLDFGLPKTCAGCDLAGTWMCEYCRQELIEVRTFARCPRCGGPIFGDGIVSCMKCASGGSGDLFVSSRFVFDGPARQTVHLLKYSGQWARAAWIAEELRMFIPQPSDELALVPVPLGAKRLKRRGFNQALKISDELSTLTGIPVVTALARTRETSSQVGLRATERVRNVRGAFACTQEVKGLDIVLVDDVVTTGATLSSCAAELRLAGASTVRGLTFAVDVLRQR